MAKTKRGDTFIEVMFAFAIFSLVAIITLSTMSLWINTGENSLELTVARNELNAQAEALRFIHSSYVSELTLPDCNPGDGPEVKCQRYKPLWDRLTNQAVYSNASIAAANHLTIEYPLNICETAYDDSSVNSLVKNHAFIINTRELLARGSFNSATDDDAIIYARSMSDTDNLSYPAQLNARVIYSIATGANGDNGGANTTTGVQTLTDYTRVARVEGIWVIAVRESTGSANPKYYDFYIQTCWNGANSNTPTSLDTIVRLYNPET